jgi:hypothetical protein
VNDRNISENAHTDVVGREATDRHRSSGLCQKLFLVDKRPVWIRAQEVVRPSKRRTSPCCTEWM